MSDYSLQDVLAECRRLVPQMSWGDDRARQMIFGRADNPFFGAMVWFSEDRGFQALVGTTQLVKDAEQIHTPTLGDGLAKVAEAYAKVLEAR